MSRLGRSDPSDKPAPERRDPRPTIALITATVVMLAVYLVLLGSRGIGLIREGTPAAVGLGIGVVILPLIGVWAVYATLRAGLAHQRLARRIHEEGRELDVTDLPRRPSGRIERAAADELFAQVKTEWQAAPDDWRSSFRLAKAYDYAGDRTRARETMKRAVRLEAAERSGPTPA